MNRKEAFRRWLQGQRIKKTGKLIPERIIESYIKGVSQLSDTMYEEGIISKRLYSMRSLEELLAATCAIKKDKTYLSLNQKNENQFHKALEQYIAFTTSEVAAEVKEEG